MCKDVLINFRISSEDRENAKELVQKLGYKNLSAFLREYLQELSNLNNKNISELELLEEIYNNKLFVAADPGERFFIKRNLNLIKQFKEVIEKENL